MSFVAFSVLCVVAGVFATPGGVNEIDPSDSNVQAAADFAVGEISAQSKTVNPYVRTSISGTQQVKQRVKRNVFI